MTNMFINATVNYTEHFVPVVETFSIPSWAIIACLGIVGNIATIAKILHDSKFHTPTFAAIGFLALADFFSIVSFTLSNVANMISFDLDMLNFDYATIVRACFDMFYLSSTGHVLLLSCVRYLITAHPFHSRQHLTVTAVSLCSLSIWFVSMICAVAFFFIRAVMELYSLIMRVIYHTIVLVIVCIIMASMHFKKLTALQNSLCETRLTEKRMNVVVVLIIFIFVLLNLSLIAENMYKYLFLQSSIPANSFGLSIYLNAITAFCAYVNYACNPYILFFLPIFMQWKTQLCSLTCLLAFK